MPGAEHHGAIGSDSWPGVAKAVEESGEFQQVLGKILAFPVLGEGELHPDGSNLTERLEDEIGDLCAIVDYMVHQNSLNQVRITERRNMKIERFMKWDREERTRRAHLQAGPQDPARVWARLLLKRDGEQGRRVLERMVAWYAEHDGRADDMGRFYIVQDAEAALEETS